MEMFMLREPMVEMVELGVLEQETVVTVERGVLVQMGQMYL